MRQSEKKCSFPNLSISSLVWLYWFSNHFSGLRRAPMHCSMYARNCICVLCLISKNWKKKEKKNAYICINPSDCHRKSIFPSSSDSFSTARCARNFISASSLQSIWTRMRCTSLHQVRFSSWFFFSSVLLRICAEDGAERNSVSVLDTW